MEVDIYGGATCVWYHLGRRKKIFRDNKKFIINHKYCDTAKRCTGLSFALGSSFRVFFSS